MFTRIFKSDYIFQFIFILIVSVSLFANALLTESPINTYNNSPLMYLLNQILGNNSFFIITINFFLLIFEALLLKRVLSSNELIPKKSLLPSFIYIITLSSFLNFHILQPILFVNLFLILVLQFILTIYNKPESYISIFNIGALISVSSLFYFASVIFFAFILISFLVFSILKWREWVISILGFITTYILYFSFAFLFDNFEIEILKYKDFFQSIQLQPIKIDIQLTVFIIILGLLFIISAFSSLNKLFEKSIYYRKKVIVLLMFFLCSLFTFIFPSELITFHLGFTLIPVVFFISTYILNLKNKYISEVIFLLFIGVSIYNLI